MNDVELMCWTRPNVISGTPLRYGRGTSSSTTAPSAETTSWTSALNVKPTKVLRPTKSAQLLGAFATTPFTSTAYHDG